MTISSRLVAMLSWEYVRLPKYTVIEITLFMLPELLLVPGFTLNPQGQFLLLQMNVHIRSNCIEFTLIEDKLYLHLLPKSGCESV